MILGKKIFDLNWIYLHKIFVTMYSIVSLILEIGITFSAIEWRRFPHRASVVSADNQRRTEELKPRSKGQTISKGFFLAEDSPKKTNENTSYTSKNEFLAFIYFGSETLHHYFLDIKLKFTYSEKATTFCEISTNICPMYSNDCWRFCKLLWPSQNIWTLISK